MSTCGSQARSINAALFLILRVLVSLLHRLADYNYHQNKIEYSNLSPVLSITLQKESDLEEYIQTKQSCVLGNFPSQPQIQL